MLSVLEHIAEAGNNGSVVHGPGVDAARVTRGYADDTDYLLRRDATSLAHPPSVTGASVEEVKSICVIGMDVSFDQRYGFGANL